MKRLSGFFYLFLLCSFLIFISFKLSTYFIDRSDSSTKISGSPEYVSFGELKIGSTSAQKDITIKNVGKSELAIRSVTLSGISTLDFNQTNDCNTLQSGDSCTIITQFRPTNPFGKKRVEIVISSNDPKRPVLTLNLSGQAPAPLILASPRYINFGNIDGGSTSIAKSIKIKNIGKGDLRIDSVYISGNIDAAQFSQSNDCSSIPMPHGETCAVTVVLSPSIFFGTKNAVIHIVSNDPRSSTVSIQLFATGPPPPRSYNLAGTGQTMCYDGGGDVIVCPPPGNALAQDGSYNGTALSYIDNLNGTVTDNITGLAWQQEDDGRPRIWAQAAMYCAGLSLGGYSGWRLPSKKELHSIVNYGISNPGPTISSTFSNAKANYYWSATEHAHDSGTAWAVNFYAGYVFYNRKDINYYVRCVRGEQSPPKRFVDNGNGTVTDSNTGLMWQQGVNPPASWEGSISLCEWLSLGGRSDWRLPNIKELESLTDDTQYGPSIEATAFPDTQPFHYWSSTTYAGDTGYAWYVVFQYGSAGNSGSKSNDYHVRCVRNER